jgi:hypothetical protein
MNINIELNRENTLYLTNFELDNKNEFLNYIMNLGFKEYDKLKNINFNNSFIQDNSINDKIVSNIDLIIENNTNKLYNLINEIKIENNLYKTNTSKGIDGENFIYNFFSNNFNQFSIEDTSQISHSGDFKLYIPEINENVILEVKNYKNTIDQKQIDKLHYDLNYTGINYAIFISLNSNIVNKKNNIEWDIKDNKIIIFISNCTTQLLLLSVYILINLYNIINNQKKQTNVNNINEKELLHIVNTILLQKNTIHKLKNNILSLHNNVSNEIITIYNSIAIFENELLYNLNNLHSLILNNIPINNNNNKLMLTNDITHQLTDLKLSKNLKNTIEIILLDFLDKYTISFEKDKKIIIHNNEINYLTIKILKNSINLITKDNIEIKNIDLNNWYTIQNLFK